MQLCAALPWATTHHHSTRCLAHVVLSALLDHFTAPPLLPEPSAQLLLQPLRAFTAANPAASRLLDACGLVLQPSAARLGDVRTVLSGHVALAGGAASAGGPPLEAAPVPLMDAILQCLHDRRQEARSEQITSAGVRRAACKPSQR